MTILDPTAGGVAKRRVGAARRRDLRGEALRVVAGSDWLDAACGVPARAAMIAHPGFPLALARLAGGMTSLYSGNRLLNRLLSDRGRNFFGLLLLYLDALPASEGGGLTSARLAALCTATGLCSRGRAKAMLALMSWGGYVAPAASAALRALPMETLPAITSALVFSVMRALGSEVPAKLGADAA